jgi:hypothetical protein
MGTLPPFRELIAAANSSAVHLEMRDAYTPSDPAFLDWRAGRPRAVSANRGWYDLVREHTARGIRFRRARVVSEPVSDFIRFEYDSSSGNIAAGEEVSWLPRRQASDLCLPGNDFWLFDDNLIRFHYFSGDGEIVEDELCSDPLVITACRAAFETIWDRAVPHAEYRPA